MHKVKFIVILEKYWELDVYIRRKRTTFQEKEVERRKHTEKNCKAFELASLCSREWRRILSLRKSRCNCSNRGSLMSSKQK